MFTYRRFVLFAAVLSATFVLYGCQPTTENDEIRPTKEVTPSSIQMPDPDTSINTVENIDPHASHDMTKGEMMADEAQMTDILKDYTKSVSQMHDEMLIGMGYNDPDTAFAKSMLGHHRGAVDMAEIELKYGTATAMRKLAQAIITAQQTEIDTLKRWLASHPDVPDPKHTTQTMQQAYADSMTTMDNGMAIGIANPVPDVVFAQSMLLHHMGSVDMATVQLKFGEDREMLKLAQEIINAQQPEIELMQNWIATHGANDGVTLDNTNLPEAVEPTKANKPNA